MQVSKKSGKHSNGKIFTSFDVITYALVKIFTLLCLPDFLETCIVFFRLMRPLSKVKARRDSSFAIL